VTVRVRPAELGDAHAVAAIHVAAWRAAYRDIVPDDYLNALSVESRELIWRQAIEKGLPEVWVAVDDTSMLGWVAFGQCRDPDKSTSVGEVWAIYVAPAHWSRGVGRALWQAARTRFEERDFKEATLWVLRANARALRFYRAAGFFPDERTIRKTRVGGATLEEIRYEAILDPRGSLTRSD